MDKERKSVSGREFYKQHRERILTQAKAYYNNNKDKVYFLQSSLIVQAILQMKIYKNKNREKILENKKKRAEKLALNFTADALREKAENLRVQERTP